MYAFREDPSWKSTSFSTRHLMSSDYLLTILRCWWVCLVSTLPYPTMWSLSSRCSRKWWTIVQPDVLHQMISSACCLDDGILSRLLWLMVKRIRGPDRLSLVVDSQESSCVSVESSFIIGVSNFLLNRHYVCSLKHRRAFLLFSSWAFQAGGSCGGLVPLSQCYRKAK